VKTLYSLFFVSVLLFVSGIAFVIAAGRTARTAPAAASAPAIEVPPVATVKHIMRGITMPAAAAVWDSVSTIVDATGVHENVPKTDADWAGVSANAAVLAESANMLLTGNRAVDKGDWVKFATALRDKANKALTAADAKNADGILTVGEEINAACDACHERYQRQ
jgi:cytochrome c556